MWAETPGVSALLGLMLIKRDRGYILRLRMQGRNKLRPLS
jgi:hypothetical protein